jgi:vanillate O-demethylase monooxygenase subunit
LEDVEVLEAQQIMIDTDDSMKAEVGVRADGGSVAARRIVEKLVKQQSTALAS